MENEDKIEVDEIEELDENDDTIDWKAEALKSQGIAKRYSKSHKELRELKQAQVKAEAEAKAKTKAENPEKAPEKFEKFDYGQLAYLGAKGVPEEDNDFLLEEVKSTGKELKDVLNFKYVQEELKNRNDKRTAETALPSGTKRSSGAAKDSVDYWIAKGEMPDRFESPELYRKIRKERERIELQGRKFVPRR